MIGPNVRISSRAVVEESIILGNVMIEKRVKIRRAIVDEHNVIGEGRKIGFDQNLDAARFHLDPAGIVVIPHASPMDDKKIL